VKLGLADQEGTLVRRIVVPRELEQLAAAESRGVEENDGQAKHLRTKGRLRRG
jgi:hypothetical protein